MKKTLLNLAALAASGLVADTAICGVHGAKIGLPNETIKSLNIHAGHQKVAAPVAQKTAQIAVRQDSPAANAAKKDTSTKVKCHGPVATQVTSRAPARMTVVSQKPAAAKTPPAAKFAKNAVASGAAFAQRGVGFASSHACA